jgi:MoxR-like ATPase
MATVSKRQPKAVPSENHVPPSAGATTPAPAAQSVQAKFAACRRELAAALIERDAEIDLVLTALVANENPLLLGPPGVGKSFLIDNLLGWVDGATKFSWLLGKFSEPNEIFGPLDLVQLKAGRQVRVTAGKLPEAHLAFIDEIFKANTAILNTLLPLMNERIYYEGAGARKIPLRLLLSASNEVPQGEELSALWDRFLLRKFVRPVVTLAGKRRLRRREGLTPKFSTTITLAEIDQATAAAKALPVSNDAWDAQEAILHELTKPGGEGIIPSDRRQSKSMDIARAFAWLDGASEVQPTHLEIFAHVLWDDANEHPEKVAKVVAKIANPIGMQVNSASIEAEEILAGVNIADLKAAAVATQKLTDLGVRLIPHKGDPRVAKLQTYLREQIEDIRRGSFRGVVATNF